jgi:hypothetical protein
MLAVEVDRARRNGRWLGGAAGVLVGLLAMVTVGVLLEMPGWLGVNLAWFAVAGATVGRRRAESTRLPRPHSAGRPSGQPIRAVAFEDHRQRRDRLTAHRDPAL